MRPMLTCTSVAAGAECRCGLAVLADLAGGADVNTGGGTKRVAVGTKGGGVGSRAGATGSAGSNATSWVSGDATGSGFRRRAHGARGKRLVARVIVACVIVRMWNEEGGIPRGMPGSLRTVRSAAFVGAATEATGVTASGEPVWSPTGGSNVAGKAG